MRNRLMAVVESKRKRADELVFDIGDTVRVTMRIVEGSRERLQKFEGTVIARRGQGLDETFVVRRLVGDQGVERTFPLHSPNVVAIEAIRHGRVRRCKLYFLRDKIGKARKLPERRISAEAKKQAAAARDEKARKQMEASETIAASRAERREPADAELTAGAT
ncbi:MAG: 50S ribosomal protein L19 [Planctomycetes bacterium]|nr:50S ribosomal protein L19 [Planctomycetota bacterium]